MSKIFFHWWIICQCLSFVSCDISCYECPSETNTFDYLVTADRIPETLKNCSLKTNMIECTITIFSQQNPNSTQITVSGADTRSSASSDHLLDVAVGFENKDSTLQWEQVLTYTCSTDQCNRFDQFKRLISSLTVNETLADLTNLLEPVEPFQGQWCYRSSNVTFTECNITMSNSSCTQCSLAGQINRTQTELCATCLTGGTDKNFLSYGEIIDMNDRTSTHFWLMQCQSENCNSIKNGDLIRQKSRIDFDFNKFYKSSSELISLSSVGKMVLIFVVFFVKVFF